MEKPRRKMNIQRKCLREGEVFDGKARRSHLKLLMKTCRSNEQHSRFSLSIQIPQIPAFPRQFPSGISIITASNIDRIIPLQHKIPSSSAEFPSIPMLNTQPIQF
jgi:hypothetical protein